MPKQEGVSVKPAHKDKQIASDLSTRKRKEMTLTPPKLTLTDANKTGIKMLERPSKNSAVVMRMPSVVTEEDTDHCLDS